MARAIPFFTVSGESKLTSPWSRRYGLSSANIISRMRMMPDRGTPSRYDAMADPFHNVGEHALRAADGKIADVKVARADVEKRADRPRTDVFRRRARRELARQFLRRDRQEARERGQR